MINTFIAIDTETTGLSYLDDRVIELGIAVFLKGKCVQRFGFILKNDSVPNQAQIINGITGEMIDAGCDPEWAFALISSVMHKVPRTIVGYNIPFDLMMLAHEFRRNNTAYNFDRIRFLDPLVIERKYRPFGQNKLVNVAERYRLEYENAHRASYDAEMAGHIFMLQQLRFGLSHMPAAVLSEKLRLWANEWGRSFTEYKESRGESVTLTRWPYEIDYASFNTGDQSLLW
jgi:DNA polymerase III alpha subunit (gram-positive type)